MSASTTEKEREGQQFVDPSQAAIELRDKLASEHGTARRQELLKKLWKLMKPSDEVAPRDVVNRRIASTQLEPASPQLPEPQSTSLSASS